MEKNTVVQGVSCTHTHTHTQFDFIYLLIIRCVEKIKYCFLFQWLHKVNSVTLYCFRFFSHADSIELDSGSKREQEIQTPDSRVRFDFVRMAAWSLVQYLCGNAAHSHQLNGDKKFTIFFVRWKKKKIIYTSNEYIYVTENGIVFFLFLPQIISSNDNGFWRPITFFQSLVNKRSFKVLHVRIFRVRLTRAKSRLCFVWSAK